MESHSLEDLKRHIVEASEARREEEVVQGLRQLMQSEGVGQSDFEELLAKTRGKIWKVVGRECREQYSQPRALELLDRARNLVTDIPDRERFLALYEAHGFKEKADALIAETQDFRSEKIVDLLVDLDRQQPAERYMESAMSWAKPRLDFIAQLPHPDELDRDVPGRDEAAGKLLDYYIREILKAEIPEDGEAAEGLLDRVYDEFKRVNSILLTRVKLAAAQGDFPRAKGFLQEAVKVSERTDHDLNPEKLMEIYVDYGIQCEGHDPFQQTYLLKLMDSDQGPQFIQRVGEEWAGFALAELKKDLERNFRFVILGYTYLCNYDAVLRLVKDEIENGSLRKIDAIYELSDYYVGKGDFEKARDILTLVLREMMDIGINPFMHRLTAIRLAEAYRGMGDAESSDKLMKGIPRPNADMTPDELEYMTATNSSLKRRKAMKETVKVLLRMGELEEADYYIKILSQPGVRGMTQAGIGRALVDSGQIARAVEWAGQFEGGKQHEFVEGERMFRRVFGLPKSVQLNHAREIYLHAAEKLIG